MENLVEALSVAAIGISIVMILLVVMSYIVNFLKVFSKDKQEKTPVLEPVAPPPVEENVEIVVENTEYLDVIAVITAAIASSLNVPEDRFIIRSIKRTNSWNEAARRERQAR